MPHFHVVNRPTYTFAINNQIEKLDPANLICYQTFANLDASQYKLLALLIKQITNDLSA